MVTTDLDPPAGAMDASINLVCQYTVSYTTGEGDLQESWLFDWMLEWLADPSVRQIARSETTNSESRNSLTIVTQLDQSGCGTRPSHGRLFDQLSDRVDSLTVHCQSPGPSADTVDVRPLEVSG